MSIHAVDLAIFERLVGFPLDNTGRPKTDEQGVPVNRLIVAPPLSNVDRLPSYGVRIPLSRQGVDTVRGQSSASSKPVRPSKDFNFTTYKQVPVFPVGVEGVLVPRMFPSVAFYWHDEEFNPSTYVYADPFKTTPSDSPVIESLNRNGEVVASGNDRVRFRQHPEPFDLLYAIRLWSKDFNEMKWMVDSIHKLFPARGVLEVEQMDGSKLPFDMMLDSVVNLDEGGSAYSVGKSLDGNEQRPLSRAFIFRIESYIDNTTGFDRGQEWEDRVITKRILELADMQDRLLVTHDVEDQSPAQQE